MIATLASVEVNTERKAKRLVKRLRNNGRMAFYEQFADYKGFFYVVYYRTKGVRV